MGNKCDVIDKRVVLHKDAQCFAHQMGIQLYEASAKENINVEEVKRFIVTFCSLFPTLTPLFGKKKDRKNKTFK